MARGKAIWALCLFLAVPGLWGCAQKHHVKTYILMEKQLADMPKRHRTTAKIVVQGSRVQEVEGSREMIEETLKKALEDLRKDDPELDAALVWAYRNRGELNQTFTLGKLEWSKDKKGWEGKQNLTDEIIVEIR